MAAKVSKSLFFLFLLFSVHGVSPSSDLTSTQNFKRKGLRRGKLKEEQTSRHDAIDPPTTIPTNPVTGPTNPVTNPTIITVPATNPVSVIPTPNSFSNTVPSTNPVNTPQPVTNPVTTPSTVPGVQPVTNPVTTDPTPSGGVPATNPVFNPATTPATVSPSSAVPGQSWCVANAGASEIALQQALDYACGIGGADCSGIQQGAGCYNPNTLQNHASYAFNSYFQKNPVQTSCDFGGSATITNTNPSSGSCIYPLSSSGSVSPATTTPTPAATIPPPTSTTTPTPASTIPPPTSSTTSGPALVPVPPGSETPPDFLNMTSPGSGATTFGDSSPGVDSSTASMLSFRPFMTCIILIASIITEKIVLDV